MAEKKEWGECMIQVKRIDHPEWTGKNRFGKTVTRPASHECIYRYEGREIARYTSRNDCLMLRTDYIGCDFDKSIFERATSCEYADAYKYLFGMLGVDETSHMSEYTYA